MPIVARKPFYFCFNCKKIVHSLEDLYVVEESLKRTFCSDGCVVQFFSSVIAFLEQEEKGLRAQLNLSKEECLKYLDEKEFVDKTLMTPDEIWVDINDMGEEHYYLIKKFTQDSDEFHMIITCFFYKGTPSFVFFQTVTSNEKLLKQYKVGQELKEHNLGSPLANDQQPTKSAIAGDIVDNIINDLPLDAGELQAIELKKSIYLAKLLEHRKSSDIDFEHFPLYDKFFPNTIEFPDEVYEGTDDDDDNVKTYIKFHQESGVMFYYVAICMSLEQENEIILPILAFPTLDPKLLEKYQIGEKTAGTVLN